MSRILLCMAKGLGNDVHIAFARAGAEQDDWKTKPQSWLSRWPNGLLLQERSCTAKDALAGRVMERHDCTSHSRRQHSRNPIQVRPSLI
jgi:hypothetical protein